jgi:hypothetical protein
MSKSRLLSGKIKKKKGAQLTADRYNYLDVSQAEPDLGLPSSNNAVLLSNTDGSRRWASIPGSINLYQAGTLQTYTGTIRWYAPYNLSVSSILPRVVASADQSIIVVVKKNGISAVTLTILANATTTTAYTSGLGLAFGDYITVDVTQAGSSSQPGSDLYVQFSYSQSS